VSLEVWGEKGSKSGVFFRAVFADYERSEIRAEPAVIEPSIGDCSFSGVEPRRITY